MAAAAPFVPMMIGAGLGAAMNRDNPLAGAALGAVGGAVAGPALGALGGAGAAGAGAAGAQATAGAGAGTLIDMGGGMMANLPVGAPSFLGSLGAGDLGMAGKALVSGAGSTGSNPMSSMMKMGMNAFGQRPQAAPMAPAPAPRMGGGGQVGSFQAMSPYAGQMRQRGLLG